MAIDLGFSVKLPTTLKASSDMIEAKASKAEALTFQREGIMFQTNLQNQPWDGKIMTNLLILINYGKLKLYSYIMLYTTVSIYIYSYYTATCPVDLPWLRHGRHGFDHRKIPGSFRRCSCKAIHRTGARSGVA